MADSDWEILQQAQHQIGEILQDRSFPPLPQLSVIEKASAALIGSLPDKGFGLKRIRDHLFEDVAPGFNGSSLSPTYYGFVTGGITPAARLADNLVTLFDQNVSVHLPDETVSTIVEERALCMLLDLFEFHPHEWPTKTLTTGATASNILGLACGRDYIISEKLRRKALEVRDGESILLSCMRAGVVDFQILSTSPHSSLGKAANIVGIGSSTMVDVTKDGSILSFDMAKVETLLSNSSMASIVVISCGEINTGVFATNSVEEVQILRDLCNKYGAWLHVDGAFGLLARALPKQPRYDAVRAGAAGFELVDSIGGDGHKLLNVPYDCGFFFNRYHNISSRVFQNVGAAYLKSSATDGIVSPLNIRLENSARFRGLPLYATLCAYGRQGHAEMIARMVDLARKIALYIDKDCDHLELLPRGNHTGRMESIYMNVLFRAKDDTLNQALTAKVKATRKVYASGTQWEGKPASRFAIAKWDVDVERDFEIVKDVLQNIV